MNEVERNLLQQLADISDAPEGAYNIRKNGATDGRKSTINIEIVNKTDPEKPGIEIHVKDNTKETVHIPVLITESGVREMVYNDFYIGEHCDVDIVAGCGIHNCGPSNSQHDGVHTFYVGKGSKVRYAERHYGEGEGTGERIMNPQTIVYLAEDAMMDMDTTQLRGVDSTRRYTKVVVAQGGEIVVTEKLLTHGEQLAESEMDIILDGDGARGRVISRSVAQDSSKQVFYPRMEGNASCFGHVQCDAILMGEAKIRAIPAIAANHTDAQLVHEAAIGRIAGEQIIKLMTLGLTEEEAEERILSGFLR